MTASLRVYFILAVKCNRIRIGCSANIGRRVYEHWILCPDDLKFLGTVAASQYSEKYLHRLFADFPHHGEWFDADQSIFYFIDAHCTKDEIEVTCKKVERRRIRRVFCQQKEIEQQRIEQEFISKYEALDKRYKELVDKDELKHPDWQTIAQGSKELGALVLRMGKKQPTWVIYARLVRKRRKADRPEAVAA